MPAPPRKRAPARKRSPAVAARAEASATTAVSPTIVLPFRGETFDLPRVRLGSARTLLAYKTGVLHSMIFEVIGPKDAERFIGLCAEGESIQAVAFEFFEALNKAVKSPNS